MGSQRRLLLLLVGALLLLGAAAPPEAPFEIRRAIEIIRLYHIHADTLEASRLLEGAARELARDVPWLMVDPGPPLRLATPDGTVLLEAEAPTLDDLPIALARVKAAVETAPLAVPGRPDLSVSLIRGAVSSLDRYSRLLVGTEAVEDSHERSTGTFTGIGITHRLREGVATVVKVVESGPAHRAGVAVGDQIRSVDGMPVAGLDPEDLTARLRGPSGSSVRLLLGRGEVERTVTVVRAPLHKGDGTSRILPSGVAVLDVDDFSPALPGWLATEMFRLHGAGGLGRGLVLDLRGNGGGKFQSALALADHLLARGLLVRAKVRDGSGAPARVTAYEATRRIGFDPAIPLVVLVDDETASASEIVAGALRQNDRAILVGTRTVGKATAWRVVPIREDLRVQVTLQENTLAGGLSVADQGLAPDLQTGRLTLDERGIRPQEDLEADLPTALFVKESRGFRPGPPPPDRPDPEVTLAERILLDARGPSRRDVLAAARRVLAQVQDEEEARLAEGCTARGLDWRAAPVDDPQAQPMDADVRLETDPVLSAGTTVTLRAVVENHGSMPLWRARVQLRAPGSRWDRLALPVGYVPAAGSATAAVTVTLPPLAPTRADGVAVGLEAEGRPVRFAGTHLLSVVAVPEPRVRLAVSAERRPEGTFLVVEGTNLGEQPLDGVEPRVRLRDLDRVALADVLPRFPVLAPGESARVEAPLELREGGAGERIRLTLRLHVDGYGTRNLGDVVLVADTTPVRVETPHVRWACPAEVAAGQPARARVVVDGAFQVLSVEHGDRRILAVLGGASAHTPVDVPWVPQEGPNRLRVRVLDPRGLTTTSEHWIHGAPTP